MNLHGHQSKNIEEIREAMRQGIRRILLQAPTGYGKTVVGAFMLQTAEEKKIASAFLVHRRELIRQSMRVFRNVGVRYGVIAAGFHMSARPFIQIASVQSFARRMKFVRRPMLFLWDECHHLAAGGWDAIHAAFPDAYHIGFSATPERLDGQGLGKYFQKLIAGPSVAWLIENGFLSKYRLFAPGSISTEGVHVKMGDFVRSELAAAADKPTVTGDAIKHYQRYAAGKRALVFASSIAHSKHIVAQAIASGIRAAHVDGETPTEERDETIRKFEAGELDWMSNVELFGEGFDVPATEGIICLRPTKSVALWLQMCGRGLRAAPGKEFATIFDHAGNCLLHGLPDEERIWSLDGRSVRARAGNGAVASVRICPKCFAAQYAGTVKCGQCGHVFSVAGRDIEHQDGELIEVDPATLARARNLEQVQATDMNALIALGKKRKLRHPAQWARHIIAAREAKKKFEEQVRP